MFARQTGENIFILLVFHIDLQNHRRFSEQRKSSYIFEAAIRYKRAPCAAVNGPGDLLKLPHHRPNQPRAIIIRCLVPPTPQSGSWLGNLITSYATQWNGRGLGVSHWGLDFESSQELHFALTCIFFFLFVVFFSCLCVESENLLMKAAVDGDEMSMPSADGSQSISHVGNATVELLGTWV